MHSVSPHNFLESLFYLTPPKFWMRPTEAIVAFTKECCSFSVGVAVSASEVFTLTNSKAQNIVTTTTQKSLRFIIVFFFVHPYNKILRGLRKL